MIGSNNKGYTLVETMVSLAILGTIAGSTLMLVNNQSKYIYYLEDRLSLANLRAEISQELRVSRTCNSTFEGKVLSENAMPFEIKNKSGDVLYTYKNEEQKNIYERLNIINMTYKNVDVPKEMGSGWIEINLHTERQRDGGGPKVLAPSSFRIRLSTTSHQMIASCDVDQITALNCGSYVNGEIKTLYEGECPYRKIRKDICVASLWLMYERKDDPACDMSQYRIQEASSENGMRKFK